MNAKLRGHTHSSRYARRVVKRFRQYDAEVHCRKEAVLAVYHEVPDEVLKTSRFDRITTRLQDRGLGMAEHVRKLVEENAGVRRDQKEYLREYDVLATDCKKISENFA